MGDFNAIGEQFVKHFYQTLGSDKTQVASLYAENSMLTFEGEQFLGTANIIGKYQTIGSVRIPPMQLS